MKSIWWQGRRGEWYVVAQFLFFALIAFGPKALPGLSVWQGPALPVTQAMGVLLGLLGGYLLAAGMVGLGRNLTALPHPKQDATLVQNGVYALVRHPIYSGILFVALGWALFQGSSARVLYVAVLFLFFVLKSQREERQLVQKFPAYAAYQRRVRRLIPFLY